MKKFSIIPILFVLIFLSGCVSPRYDDNFRVDKIVNDTVYGKPDKIYVKYIKEGSHDGNYYYTYGIDTIYTPRGNDWLRQEHLKFFKTPPTNEEDKRRFALILHENAHCINTHDVFLPFLTMSQWTNEREGYQVQIRYLTLAGIKVYKKGFIGAINNKRVYGNMASYKEIKSFVDSTVENALKEKSSYQYRGVSPEQIHPQCICCLKGSK